MKLLMLGATLVALAACADGRDAVAPDRDAARISYTHTPSACPGNFQLTAAQPGDPDRNGNGFVCKMAILTPNHPVVVIDDQA